MKTETEISAFGSKMLDSYGGKLLAEQANNFLDNVSGKATGIVDNAADIADQWVQEQLIKGIEAIYDSMGLNSESMNMLKSMLNTASTSVAKVLQLSALFPADVQFAPCNKSVSQFNNQIPMNIARSMFADFISQYNSLYNATMSVAALPMEVLAGTVNVALEEAEKIIDEKIFEYTGFHLLEMHNMCIKGVQIYQSLKRVCKKDAIDRANEQTESLKNEIKDTAENNINESTDALSDITDNIESSYDNLESKKPNSDTIKDVTSNKTSLTVGIDTAAWKQIIYDLLYQYIGSIAQPAVQAGFQLLILKDQILDMKDIFVRLTNISIEDLIKSIETFDDIIAFFDKLLAAKPLIISLAEIKQLGLNTALLAMNSAKQAFDNAKNAKQMLAGYSWQKTVAGSMAMIDVGTKTTSQTNISFNVNEAESNATGYQCIDVVLYTDPAKSRKQITNSLSDVIVDGKQVFSAHSINECINELSNAWKHNANNYKFPIQALISGVTRIYQFTVTVNNSNKDTVEKPDNNVLNNTSPELPTENADAEQKMQALTESEIVGKTENEHPTKGDIQFMFEIVFTLLKQLKILQPVFREIAKLIENYKINKAKCASVAADRLLKMGINALKNTMGNHGGASSLPDNIKEIDRNTRNFYTVRTMLFAKFLEEQMNIIPDAQTAILDINEEQTNYILSDYTGTIDKTALKSDIPTTLYFDNENIMSDQFNNNKSIKDGSLTGLDKITFMPGVATLYVIDSNKPMETSELVRAVKKSNLK